jgi:hypothetical protein
LIEVRLIDVRDLRDPRAGGEALLRLRQTAKFKDKPLHVAADAIERGIDLPAYATDIPLYPGDESSVAATVATRQQELRDRAARGDKYAISMLKGEAFHEPSDGE